MDRQERCRRVVSAINQLGQTQLEELFKLLHNHKCTYTKNGNGIFVNLSWIPDNLLDMMEQYIAFCNQSKTEVCKYESLCEALNKNLHANVSIETDKVAETGPTSTEGENQTSSDSQPPVSRVSSSMKFYLLKKKFSKQNVVNSQGFIKNDLKPDSYIYTTNTNTIGSG